MNSAESRTPAQLLLDTRGVLIFVGLPQLFAALLLFPLLALWVGYCAIVVFHWRPAERPFPWSQMCIVTLALGILCSFVIAWFRPRSAATAVFVLSSVIFWSLFISTWFIR